jgi:hypothetical protein
MPSWPPSSGTWAPGVAASFNAGFLMDNANGGCFTDGKTVLPLRKGAASFSLLVPAGLDEDVIEPGYRCGQSAPTTLKSWLTKTWCGQLTPMLWTSYSPLLSFTTRSTTPPG